MYLHLAISILCSEKHCITHNDIAKKLIQKFIKTFGDCYGLEHIVYNVHTTEHLPFDVLTYGCLDNFSAFPFESYMFKVKSMIHKKNHSLQQLTNRISEKYDFYISELYPNAAKNRKFKKKVKVTIDGNQTFAYKEIRFKNTAFSDTSSDGFFFTHSNKIVRFLYALNIENDFVIYGREVSNQYEHFFELPIQSKKLNIIEIHDDLQFELINKFCSSDIKLKMFSMSIENSTIFYPLLHFDIIHNL